MPPFTIAVHGGAGVISSAVERHGVHAYTSALAAALEAGRAILASGGAALDAVEAAVCVLEDCELFNAGRGSVFCEDGTHRMEASMQDGRTCAAGAVLGLRTTRHPIKGARAVMDRTRHVALADCDAWLAQQGLEQQPAGWFDTAERLQQLADAKREDVVSQDHGSGSRGTDCEPPPTGEPPLRTGTVGAVAVDSHGHLAAATSTGGMTNKMVGRIGDSPVIGAGTHASAFCAVSGTGRGEQFLRHAVCGAIGTRVAMGVSLDAACDELVHRALAPGDGGVIAVDASGNLAMPFNTKGMFRGFVREGDASAHVAVFEEAPAPVGAASPPSPAEATPPPPPTPPTPPTPPPSMTPSLELIVGSQNYSSWSLRPWIALRNGGIPFTTRVVQVFGKGVNFAVHGGYSPSGLVPVLNDVHAKLTVWDSLAIVEYAHELFPSAGIWPLDRAARARARCLAAEMHSGFGPLRAACPMNIKHRSVPDVTVTARLAEDVVSNIRRIEDIWATARRDFGCQAAGMEAGPYLFGRFSAADAFFSPVVWRFCSYGIVLSDPLAVAYFEAMLADPGMLEWEAAALAEEAKGLANPHYDEFAKQVGK